MHFFTAPLTAFPAATRRKQNADTRLPPQPDAGQNANPVCLSLGSGGEPVKPPATRRGPSRPRRSPNPESESAFAPPVTSAPETITDSFGPAVSSRGRGRLKKNAAAPQAVGAARRSVERSKKMKADQLMNKTKGGEIGWQRVDKASTSFDSTVMAESDKIKAPQSMHVQRKRCLPPKHRQNVDTQPQQPDIWKNANPGWCLLGPEGEPTKPLGTRSGSSHPPKARVNLVDQSGPSACRGRMPKAKGPRCPPNLKSEPAFSNGTKRCPGHPPKNKTSIKDVRRHITYRLNQEESQVVERWSCHSFGTTEGDDIRFGATSTQESGLSAMDIQCLVYKGHRDLHKLWLNNDVVHYYGEILMQWACRCLDNEYNNFFISPYAGVVALARWNDRDDLRWVKELMKGHHNRLFFPCVINNHYILAVADCLKQKVVVYNSMNSARHKSDAVKVGSWLRRICATVLGYDDSHSWDFVYPKDIPQQVNGHDCGVFVLTYMASIIMCGSIVPFSSEEICGVRHRVLVELSKGQLVTF